MIAQNHSVFAKDGRLVRSNFIHTLFATLYDFPGGLALALFVGFYLAIVIVINIFVVLIEALVLRKMNFGSLQACSLASFLMNLISVLAGSSTGFIVGALCDLDCRSSFLTFLALLPGFDLDPQLKVSGFYAVLFFAICYFLTVVLEMGVLLILRREHPPGRIGKMVLVANLFSYLFLIIVFGLTKVYFS